MANLLETSEIKRETVDNLISDQKSRDGIHRNRSFILKCPNCKKKFYRIILFLQHREAHKKHRKLLHSENNKKQRKRHFLDRLTNNAAFNYEKHTEKLNCNNDITNKEVVGAEHEKNVRLECKTQTREEIKIEVKDEFECSGYTLTPFTHYGVHIEKASLEEDESKHNNKNEDEKRKRNQVKDNDLRLFQCEICDKTFARKRRLTDHFRIHTGEKPFECKICFTRYRIEVSLIYHIARVHTDDEPFQCKICSLKFKTKPALIRHSITQHPKNNPYKGQTFECDVCQKKFLYKSEIFRHKRVHTREKRFHCAVCQKGYFNKLDLVKHLKSHTGDKKHFIDDSEYPVFKCEICSKTFMRKGDLKTHQRVHSDDKPFQCKICSSRFKIEHFLIAHSINHHPENNPYKGKQTFECDVCQKKFPIKSMLLKHKRFHTGEKPFNCAVCQKGYWYKLDLVRHLKSHKYYIDDSEYSSFKCEICSKTFTGKAALKCHQAVHTDDRPFQCKICSLKFKTKPVLVKHTYRQHLEDHPYKGKTFECDACQKKFPFKSMLLNHKRIHTAEKPFNCAVCQKGYWYKLDLVKHLKSHTGDKKGLIEDSEYPSFKCEICSKTFTRKEHLKRHQTVHIDDRPFQCKICSSKFKIKHSLISHSITQHPENNPYKGKTFECDVCQKKFLYKSNFLNHKSFHTKEKPFNCAICQKGYWNKSRLVQHLKSHTGNEKDFVDKSEYSPFACEVCNKTFKQKGKLTLHLRSHTDDRPFQCKICSLRFKTKPVLVKHSYRLHPEDNPYYCKKDCRCDVCQKKNLVLERCSEENASLQCEAPTKEEIKIEVKDEFECSEYTLQTFTYHGLHIENKGVEEYEIKHKYNDVHKERKHQVVDQVMEDVTDSESRDHCYVEEKLEKHNFNEPCPEVVDIKEDRL